MLVGMGTPLVDVKHVQTTELDHQTQFGVLLKRKQEKVFVLLQTVNLLGKKLACLLNLYISGNQ